MKLVIDVRNVTVSYRESVALKDISLKIGEGSLVAVAGPNGAGKTTLLTAINGLGRLLKGSVTVFGIKLTRRSATAIRKEIGYVPQIINVDPRMPMRVRDVVMFGRYGKKGFFRALSRRDREVAEEVAEWVGIRELLQRPIGHLSGGEQRKVAIARALAQEPRILLLDEPISNLDISAQQSIIDLVGRIHGERQLTTVVVMHHLDLLPQDCSRMILLKEAKVMFDGTVEDALSESVLSKLYGCSIKKWKH